jgi:16S rRNA (guanine966-N2)-methyltransferase
VLVDRDPRALAAVRQNVASTGLADRATVVRSDALAHLAEPVGPFDVVFLDPPYAYDAWPELLAAVATVAPGALVVVESDGTPPMPDTWEVVRSKRYGTTLVLFARPPAEAASRPAGSSGSPAGTTSGVEGSSGAQ